MRQLTLEEASLHDIISDTISSIRPQAESRSVSLVGEVSGGVDSVLINPPRLKRVLHNLLSNALHHTPVDGPIALRATPQGEEVRVEVTNTGEGIAPKICPASSSAPSEQRGLAPGGQTTPRSRPRPGDSQRTDRGTRRHHGRDERPRTGLALLLHASPRVEVSGSRFSSGREEPGLDLEASLELSLDAPEYLVPLSKRDGLREARIARVRPCAAEYPGHPPGYHWIVRVAGLLIDLDGTLYTNSGPIQGAREALRRLDRAGIPYRFVTNATHKPRRIIAAHLKIFGFPAREDRIFTPATAVVEKLQREEVGCYPLLDKVLLEDLQGISMIDDAPGCVLVGNNLGQGFTYERLNAAFRHLMAGAELVALSKNRYWQRAGGEPALDAGPFVAALEYASGQQRHRRRQARTCLLRACAREFGLTSRDGRHGRGRPRTRRGWSPGGGPARYPRGDWQVSAGGAISYPTGSRAGECGAAPGNAGHLERVDPRRIMVITEHRFYRRGFD